MKKEERWLEIKKILKAPKGKFRVVEVDTFKPLGEGHAIVGDYETLEEAKKKAKEGTSEIPRYIYDDKGRELSRETEVDKKILRRVQAARERVKKKGGDEQEQFRAVVGLLKRKQKKTKKKGSSSKATAG